MLKLTIDDMQRKRVDEERIPLRLAPRSQQQWMQKFERLPNGMFYGTFDLVGGDGTLLDRRGAVFGKTLAPERMKIAEDARFQVGAEAGTYCDWPDNGMTFSLMRQVNWADVAPEKGRWDWTVLDAFIDQANANNIHFVLGTAYPPPWAQGRTGPSRGRPGPRTWTIGPSTWRHSRGIARGEPSTSRS